MYKFVVIWRDSNETWPLSRVFTSRENANAFVRETLRDKATIDAYSVHRVGDKLGSFTRHTALAINPGKY